MSWLGRHPACLGWPWWRDKSLPLPVGLAPASHVTAAARWVTRSCSGGRLRQWGEMSPYARGIMRDYAGACRDLACKCCVWSQEAMRTPMPIQVPDPYGRRIFFSRSLPRVGLEALRTSAMYGLIPGDELTKPGHQEAEISAWERHCPQ
ncbi:hypothetical protein GGTG_00766 [Gaeumannomyces tritici R3-111a-1]|uniref:Uncharacterized protein n=1 Tax=Gaeumannomyces tritici (strain R3-111a-1) TaxID=644352 RepID=J3NHM9_GAET3|nr:hypothetical protein GGTG_00766 [Gaeumannomyces tritici R3-111a-1]EJT80772.1 hypothetical protein GGTG_00766 [Gaeumannomyces tritici R3-111a-1]